MSFVLSKKEFEENKKEVLSKLKQFIDDYDKFTKKTSPSHWREMGSYYMNLKELRLGIDDMTPLTMKDLDSELVRMEVLTPEEIDLWDKIKNYNL